MKSPSFRATRAELLLLTYFECREGQGYYSEADGFHRVADQRYSDTFVRIALEDLTERGYLTVTRNQWGAGAHEHYIVSAEGAVAVESFLEDAPFDLPSIQEDEAGNRTGPTIETLTVGFDLPLFELHTRLAT